MRKTAVGLGTLGVIAFVAVLIGRLANNLFRDPANII